MNVTIRFGLSTEGRKASILAGGDGREIQTVEVGPDSPDFTRALAEAVFLEGKPTVTADNFSYKMEPQIRRWDHVPTAAEVLDDLDARRAAKAREDEEDAAKWRAATLAMVREKKTVSESCTLDTAGPRTSYDRLRPAWPHNPDREVMESPEAAAWLAEIDAENERRLADAVARQAVAAAEKAEEDAIEAAREAAERAEMGLREGDEAYAIEDGALVNIPAGMWEDHRRGKNWMAVIALDPKSPGGLAREFATKAKGESFYIVPPSLSPGDAVEFGADYYSGSGRPSRRRWYGYVVRIDAETPAGPGYLILRRSSDGKHAVKDGREFLSTLGVEA